MRILPVEEELANKYKIQKNAINNTYPKINVTVNAYKHKYLFRLCFNKLPKSTMGTDSTARLFSRSIVPPTSKVLRS